MTAQDMTAQNIARILAMALSGDDVRAELASIPSRSVPDGYRVAYDAILSDALNHGTVDPERILLNSNGADGALRVTFLEILSVARTPEEARPIYTSGDLPTATRAAWEAIEHSNTPPLLFRYGGVPVRISEDDDGRPKFEVLNLDRTGHVVARVAPWKERHFDKKGKVWVERAVPPPVRVIKDLLATPSEKIPLPIVTGIVEVPTFAADGTLCDKPGYNAANRTYFAPADGLVIPDIPTHPTDEDVQRSIALLKEPFAEVPFASDADRAVPLALGLLPYVRALVGPHTPFHVFDAPIQGSGKTLSARIALAPALGTLMFVAQSDDAEYRKRITALAIAGRNLFFLDNVTAPIISASIAMAITGEVWTDRVLGLSKEISVPNKMIWVATGNNVAWGGDLKRRIIVSRIDPNTDQPWLRDGFKIPNLDEWVLVNRGRLVAAALTIIRSWVNAGMKSFSGAKPGSLVQWAKVIGGILEHAGVEGFLTNLADVYEEVDTENMIWREFVLAWWDAHQDNQVGTAELFPIAAEVEGLDLGKTGTGTEKSQRTALGKKLGAKKGVVVGGYKITAVKGKKRIRQYRLIPSKNMSATTEVSAVESQQQPTTEPTQPTQDPNLYQRPDGNWYLR